MIKFAKVIIDRKNSEYRNLHFLPQILKLMKQYEKYLFDDYFTEIDLPQALMKLIEESGRFFWVIIDSKANEMMGFAYFDKFIGDSKKLHSAEINTCFRRKYWGKMVKLAAKLFISFCFKRYGFRKIKAAVFIGNVLVKGLLKALGFKREGLLRGETYKNGKLQDVEIYSIKRSEKCRQNK